MVELSLFLPCYNEENRLEKNTLAVYDALKDLNLTFELVIVDDGSTDRTGEIGKNLADLHKEIDYVYFSNGPSRRENLGKAMADAHGKFVAFMDLDLSVLLVHLKQLVASVQDGNDIAIGSRYKGERAKRKLSRRLISGVYNTFMRLYFGSHIADHQCGFKAFKKDVFVDLAKDMGYDNNLVRGWFWDVELLVRAQRREYTIDEFPVAWTFGKQSSFAIGRELRMLPYVLRLRFRL